jgi:hypothetical protein
MNNALKTILGPVMFSKLVPSTIADSKKDKVVISQDIVREYAGARGYDSKQMSIAPADAFGKGETYTSTRKAFISVPRGTTEAQVVAWLGTLPQNAKIYSVMSNDIHDVLTDEEIQQMLTLKTETEQAERLAKYRSRYEMQNANGECFLSADGKFQYRRNFLNVGKEDDDKRSRKGSQSDFYRNKKEFSVDYLTGDLTAVTSVAEVTAGAEDSARPEVKITPVAPVAVTA